MITLTNQLNLLSDRILPLCEGNTRVLVALAGPPASGKTTLAEGLAARLNLRKCEAFVVPQDGFHLDNQVLEPLGLMPRKGAPHTFDAAGFVHLVKRLKSQEDVAVPVFDRARDLAIAGARIIPASAKVLIVEGNYLLFDADPWRTLAPLWDFSVRLDVPLPELRARLIQRWLGHGLSRVAATRRAMSNDLPNAEAVMNQALEADMTLSADGTPI